MLEASSEANLKADFSIRVTISIETKHLTIDLEALLDKLRMIDGVKRLEVLGQV